MKKLIGVAMFLALAGLFLPKAIAADETIYELLRSAPVGKIKHSLSLFPDGKYVRFEQLDDGKDTSQEVGSGTYTIAKEIITFTEKGDAEKGEYRLAPESLKKAAAAGKVVFTKVSDKNAAREQVLVNKDWTVLTIE